MDFEKRVLNLTRCLLKHAAFGKEEKDEIEDLIVQLMLEKKKAEAEKEALQEENEVLSASVKSLAQQVKELEKSDYWLEKLIAYESKVGQIQQMLKELLEGESNEQDIENVPVGF